MDGPTRHSLETVLEAVEKGHTKAGTARALGVTYNTVVNYAKRWKSVDDALRLKRRELVDLAESGLRNAVLRNEPWAIAFALRTLGKDEGYTERQEVSGPNGGEIKTAHRIDLSGLNDEELRTLERLSRKITQPDGDPD